MVDADTDVNVMFASRLADGAFGVPPVDMFVPFWSHRFWTEIGANTEDRFVAPDTKFEADDVVAEMESENNSADDE